MVQPAALRLERISLDKRDRLPLLPFLPPLWPLLPASLLTWQIQRPLCLPSSRDNQATGPWLSALAAIFGPSLCKPLFQIKSQHSSAFLSWCSLLGVHWLMAQEPLPALTANYRECSCWVWPAAVPPQPQRTPAPHTHTHTPQTPLTFPPLSAAVRAGVIIWRVHREIYWHLLLLSVLMRWIQLKTISLIDFLTSQ